MAEIPPEASMFKPATREKVRRAIASVVEDAVREDTKIVSTTKARGAGAGDQNATAALLRLWRAGKLSLADSWGEAGTGPGAGSGDSPAADLAAKVREATTDGERKAALHEAAALALEGAIPSTLLQSITVALGGARESAKQERAVEPAPQEADRMALVGEAEAKAALALFYMVSEPRRARLLRLIDDELAADVQEHPNVDSGGGR